MWIFLGANDLYRFLCPSVCKSTVSSPIGRCSPEFFRSLEIFFCKPAYVLRYFGALFRKPSMYSLHLCGMPRSNDLLFIIHTFITYVSSLKILLLELWIVLYMYMIMPTMTCGSFSTYICTKIELYWENKAIVFYSIEKGFYTLHITRFYIYYWSESCKKWLVEIMY